MQCRREGSEAGESVGIGGPGTTFTEHMFVLGIDPGLSVTGYGTTNSAPATQRMWAVMHPLCLAFHEPSFHPIGEIPPCAHG